MRFFNLATWGTLVGTGLFIISVPFSPAIPSSTSNPSASSPNDAKWARVIQFVGLQEGECQRWSKDKGNWFQGRLYSTCNGITAATLWNNRALASQPLGNLSLDNDFVRVAYDKDPQKFKKVANAILRKDYYEKAGCHQEQSPAAEICAAIIFNSGLGVKSELKAAIAQAGNPSHPKDRAKIMTQWHSSYYESIANRNPDFIGGWRRNIKTRFTYIQQSP